MDAKNAQKREFLKWNPGKLNRWYGVAFDFKTDDKESRVSFEVHVENVSMLSDGSYHFRISRAEDVFIDHYEPDMVIDEIAVKCSNFIYPIDIQVSAEGLWTGKTIHAELLKRWPDFKKKMLDEYAGGYIIHYLNKMEENIVDPKKFAKSLEKDVFIALFFSATAAIFKQKEPLTARLYPIAPPETPFFMALESEIYVSEQRTDVKVKGTLDPDTPVFIYSTVPYDTGLEINYRMDPETHFIESIWGNCFADLRSGRTETKFTAFHLKDRDVNKDENLNGDRTLYYIG